MAQLTNGRNEITTLIGFEIEQSNDRSRSRVLCPITGRPCVGDLSYLCDDYGCARKGGLSPNSDENL
jgi:hypothetical protein